MADLAAIIVSYAAAPQQLTLKAWARWIGRLFVVYAATAICGASLFVAGVSAYVHPGWTFALFGAALALLALLRSAPTDHLREKGHLKQD